MNIGTITTVGPKGQIVIPAKMRETLGIDISSPIQIFISGNGIVLYPLEDVVRKNNTDMAYADILALTQGTWNGTADKYAEYRNKEKARAKKATQLW